MHENIAELLEVRSSHGTLFINEAGFVVDVILDGPIDDDAQSLYQIRMFDLAEFVRTYGKSDKEFDILDLGYWWIHRDEENIPIRKYEPPAYDWREMTQQFQKEAAGG